MSVGILGSREPSDSAVLRKWEKMLHLLVRRNLNRLGHMYDYEDLLNHARLALWRAHRTFDPSGGAGFQTYSWSVIVHAFNALHKGASSKKRRDMVRSFSIEAEQEDSNFQLRSPSKPADAAISASEDARAVRAALECLGDRERRVVLSRLYEDKTLLEIGGEMGVTRERVRQLEKKALTQLEFSLRRDFPDAKKVAKLSLKIPKGRRPAA